MNCPYCGSANTKKKGFYFNANSKKQAYYCHACKRKFSEADTQDAKFPAVLVMDIETLPMIGYFWTPYDTSIHPDQIIRDWSVLCWSAKWLDDDRIVSDCLTAKEALGRDDKRVCQSMWKLFDEADVIIAHNGKKFDVPKLNTRWWKHKFPQPASYKIIDTLDAARRAFGMTYNSLDYLAEYLGISKKLKHDMAMWKDCDRGDNNALGRMREYNEHDVEMLETVYLKMRGWIPGHPRFTAYENVRGVCPVCFGAVQEIGLYTANANQYKEFRCTACGSVHHNTRPEKK